MKVKKTITLYHDQWSIFKLLSDEELGRLLRAVFIYEKEKRIPTFLNEKTLIAFSMIRESLDRDAEKYERVCNRNREAAKVRWKKTAETSSTGCTN